MSGVPVALAALLLASLAGGAGAAGAARADGAGSLSLDAATISAKLDAFDMTSLSLRKFRPMQPRLTGAAGRHLEEEAIARQGFGVPAGSGSGSPPTAPTSAPPAGGSSTSDGLSLVSNTSAFPFSAIGALALTFQTGSSEVNGLCSATAIAPNVLLTAAHCVWDTDALVPLTSAVFLRGWDPAKGNDQLPFGTAEVTNYWFPTAFADCGRGYGSCHTRHDVAVLRIATSSDAIIPFGVDADAAGSVTLSTAGYPGAKCEDTSQGTVCFMYYSSCANSTYDPTLPVFREDCLSYGGQSGSSLWLYFPDTQRRLIVGILTFGPDENAARQYTGATGITTELEATINGWIQQANGAPAPQQEASAVSTPPPPPAGGIFG